VKGRNILFEDALLQGNEEFRTEKRFINLQAESREF